MHNLSKRQTRAGAFSVAIMLLLSACKASSESSDNINQRQVESSGQSSLQLAR